MERFDDAPGAVERDGDDINADEAIRVFRVGIKKGGDGMEHAPGFRPNDRFRRRAMPRLRADADLDADEYIAIKSDEIEFAATTMPVPRDDPAPGLFEQKGGDPLAARSDRRIARRRLGHRAAMPVIPTGGSIIAAASKG